MKLSWRTLSVFTLLTLLITISNIYSSLLTGWSGFGSVIAVILCLIFLHKDARTPSNYNLGQTVVSAGGSVGFTVALFAAFYVMTPQWQPDVMRLSLLITAISILGVILAIPLRRIVLPWYFPSAIACASIINSVTANDDTKANRTRKVMAISGILAACFTLPAKITVSPGGQALFQAISFGRLRISIDPILYGIGTIIGPRIGCSMLLGGVITQHLLAHHFEAHGLAVADGAKWFSVGMMTLPALFTILLTLKWQSQRVLPPEFRLKSIRSLGFSTVEIAGLVLLLILSGLLMVYIANQLFPISHTYLFIAIALGFTLSIVLTKVASETDINPIRLMGIVFLAFFALLGIHDPAILLMMGIAGATLAAVIVDLYYDLRAGYLLDVPQRPQIYMQLYGVVISSFGGMAFLAYLGQHYSIGTDGYFPAPGAIMWSALAKNFAQHFEFTSAIRDIILFSALAGCVISLWETHPRTTHYSLSSFGLGIGALLPLEMNMAVAIGGLGRFFYIRLVAPKRHISEDQAISDAFQSGAAIFVGSAFTGILALCLIAAGLFYVPCIA